jgi:hypothetical protein
MDLSPWQRIARTEVEGRRVVVCAPLAAMTDDAVGRLLDLGATGVFAVGLGRGTGQPPSESLDGYVSFDVRADSVVDQFDQHRRILGDPPERLRRTLDEFDPDCEARVLGSAFIGVAEIAGREVYGRQPAELARWEDKLRAEEVWDAAGLVREPAVVVPLDAGMVRDAVDEMDAGSGAVVAADGWHGAAERTRWITHADQVAGVVSEWSGVAEQVRVMPFIEGVPCSIHAVVFPDDVFAFFPVELFVLRRAGTTDLVYSGTGATWKPAPADREYMRSIAGAVGRVLREMVGYRGGVTIDGVMGRDGFCPTELNTRLGSGFAHAGGALPDMPWGAVQRALREGVEMPVPEVEVLDEIERRLAASRPVRGIRYGSWRRTHSTTTFGLDSVDGTTTVVDDAESAPGMARVGPHAMGTMIFVQPPGSEMGTRAAPAVADALRAVDRRLGFGLGPLEAAPSVR